MNQPETNKSFMSFCAAAGAEAARRWLLCPSASMAHYRDDALAVLLEAANQPEPAAGRSREFCDGFAARIAKEIADRSSEVHYLGRERPCKRRNALCVSACVASRRRPCVQRC